MKRFLTEVTLLLAIVTAAWSPPALADDYPDRPVGVMVPYGAGGATDFQARIVTMAAGNDDLLGQPIYIQNKPGAGGRVGWNWFTTEAKNDGYALACYNLPHIIAQSIKGGVKYSPDSFEPIANWGADPAVILVSKDSKFKTIGDLVEFAKANPGKLTVSGGGLYIGHHIAFLQLQEASGAKMVYIPTKTGAAEAIKGVIAGNVLAGINNLSDAYRAAKAGNVRILAIADLERNTKFLPDVPTLKEAGYDVDDTSVNYRGLMVPKGTPQEIIDALAVKVPQMFKDKKVVSRMEAGGAPMKIMTREEVLKMWEERKKALPKLLNNL